VAKKHKKNQTIFGKFLERTIQGLFWLLPIVAITLLILWLFNKIDIFVNWIFNIVGFTPISHEYVWFALVLFVLVIILYILGHLIQTSVVSYLESVLKKIPGYSTLKDIIGIFNSSKDGENKVLVVAIKGFANEGYNIGLMYSQDESIIKDHYTITLSQTPIPNGGYLFEVHKSNIFIITEASFDDNLQYLLSMGVKSMATILNIEPKHIEELICLEEWIKQQKN
jgi:uncharacterized membrane protein